MLRTRTRGLSQRRRCETFTHLESTNVMIVPYDYVRNIGGTLNSVAVANFVDSQGNAKTNFLPDVEEFMTRVSLTMFVATRKRSRFTVPSDPRLFPVWARCLFRS